MLFLLIVYFGLIISILHTYLFYPVFIQMIAKKRKGIIKNNNSNQSTASILISAYNEEKVIEARINNIKEQCYDLDKIEVIIGSDCSDDQTNEILKSAERKYDWLKIILFNQRRGKAAVLNDLVKIAKHDILVFTDANTVFEKDAVKNLLTSFHDSNIGGVCGRLILREPVGIEKDSIEEKNYWDFETKIKRAEGDCGIVIGANGGIFAIRKELFREIPLEKAVTDDFFISLSVLAGNRKFIYQNSAIAYEEVGKKVKDEFRRKIRFAATNFQTLGLFKNLLFNRNILLSFAFWSHKVIRWFLPFIFLVILISNLLLFNLHWLFITILYIQIVFFTFAFVGFLLSILKIRISLFSFPYFFTISNIALVIGFIRFLRKKHTIIWQSTPR